MAFHIRRNQASRREGGFGVAVAKTSTGHAALGTGGSFQGNHRLRW